MIESAVMRVGRYALTVFAWWWLMMAVHELGHVLGCLLSGATIERVVLWPWTISETVRSGAHAPLIDTWAGPIVGMLLPLGVWLLCAGRPRLGRWLGGWAGFCLIANGVSLGLGWIDAVGDAGDLMRLGVPACVLATVGTIAVLAGLWCWHALIERSRSVH